MLNKWVATMVINFILRQLNKYLKGLDWGKVKADLDARVRALVPGELMDEMFVSVVNAILDRAQAVLADAKDLEKVLKLLAAQDWEGAFAALKDLLTGGWQPEGSKVATSPNGPIVRFAASPEGQAAQAVAAA